MHLCQEYRRRAAVCFSLYSIKRCFILICPIPRDVNLDHLTRWHLPAFPPQSHFFFLLSLSNICWEVLWNYVNIHSSFIFYSLLQILLCFLTALLLLFWLPVWFSNSVIISYSFISIPWLKKKSLSPLSIYYSFISV